MTKQLVKRPITEFLNDLGYDNFHEYFVECEYGNAHHVGFCVSCRTPFEDALEIDARDVECPECGRHSVSSLPVIAGVI